jgi:hypothetical protein
MPSLWEGASFHLEFICLQRHIAAMVALLEQASLGYPRDPTEDDGGLEKRLQRLFELQENLDRASAISRVHVLDVIARGCVRFHAHAASTQAKVFRLIEAGAFVDAIFTLQELELPQWKLRRIVYDDVRWHCSFSRYSAVPMELDDIAEGSHEVLPLAILNGFLGARRFTLVANPRPLRSVPQAGFNGHVVCCDNFA